MSLIDEQNPEFNYERVGELVSIFRRGSRWYANYQSGGKQHRPSLRTLSKKEARRLAIRLEADLLSGRHQAPRRAPSIEQVVAANVNYLRAEGRADATISKAELVGRRMLELAALRRARSILDVDLPFVDAYRSHRASQLNRRGKPPKPRTIMNETVKVREFVNFAKTRKMILEDPLAGLKIPKVKSSGQPCWSAAEVETVLTEVAGPYYDAFLLLADTGMRFGEAAWLTWSDIDLKNNVVLIQAKEGWKPKNGEDRAIPMSPRVCAMLSERRRRCDWVFTMEPSAKYPAGDHQLQESRLLAYLKLRLKRLGLPGKIHTFRHSLVTRALLAGIPEAVVRQWVGHLDREVTKIYTHILSPDSQAAMRRLNDLNHPSPNGKEVTVN